MRPRPPTFELTPARIDGHYRVDKKLGEGGLAVVYQVHDERTGTTKALKRLSKRDDASSHERHAELFRREFHTLDQLRHPRIVTVHEFGIDGIDPYYTMELLDGGDLFERAPVDWRTACSLARDVCSALSLLHSRRTVYRDISPRNVRCTSDGQAKLIDFGAVAPMGVCKHVVGTAAFCAPEVLDLQQLDGRTDLYALGATLYYTLTCRLPYPVREFGQLRDAWRLTPNRPSQLVPGVPEPLDDLIMMMLQLDPAARPAGAAEVMERLTGIAGLPLDEHLQVSQAYLTSPVLIGRDAQLRQVRNKLTRTARTHGGALMIRSEPGLGRSRLLDACALEAKLAGVTVLRGDAEDAESGDYGVVRALSQQLLAKLPDQARACATAIAPTLAHVLPELLEGDTIATQATFADAGELRRALQAALCTWIEEIAKDKPLLIAVDDVHRSDEPSAALLGLLARSAARHALSLVVTAPMDGSNWGHSLGLLARSTVRVELSPLRERETRALLSSIFDQAPNLDAIAERVHEIAGGNPRDVMALAQHLVDRGVITYEAGAWSLPDRIEARDLPSSLAQAMLDGVDALSAPARSFAQALALCPEQSFDHEECAVLAGCGSRDGLPPLLAELTGAGVIKPSLERTSLAQEGWGHALCSRLDPESARVLEGRIAEVFEARQDPLRLTRHLLRAGQEHRAVDVLVEHARASQAQTDPSSEAFALLVEAMPPDWIECYTDVLRVCARDGRPPRDVYDLQSRMAGLVAVTGMQDLFQLSGFLKQLEHDSGLDIYASLDPSLDAGARLQQTFERAQKRYNDSSDAERVLDPLTSIRQLARAAIQLSAATVTSRSLPFLTTFPSLKPYLALSPALGVVDNMVQAVAYRTTGRMEQARRIYLQILDRTSQPDRAGLDESHHRHGTFGIKFGLGIIEATIGLESSLARASDIASNPLYQVNAWTIRMLYYLWQGKLRDAEECKRTADVVRVQNRMRQFFENGHMAMELAAHAAAGDLIHVKRCIHGIETWARQYAGWRPLLDCAIGQYHRLRGDSRNALSSFEASIGSVGPVGHELWADAVAGAIHALVDLGRIDEAVRAGEDWLDAALGAELSSMSHLIRAPLGLARAKAGDYSGAITDVEHAIEEVERLQARGLRLANVYRARARVAQLAGDMASMRLYATHSVDAFDQGVDPRLLAKYSALLQTHATLESQTLMLHTSATTHLRTRSALETALLGCTDTEQKAQRSLELLCKASGVTSGFLFVMRDGHPLLLAHTGSAELPVQIEQLAEQQLADALDADDDMKTGMADSADVVSTTAMGAVGWPGPDATRYLPIPLEHYADDGSFKVVGLALLVVTSDAAFAHPGQLASELSRMLATS